MERREVVYRLSGVDPSDGVDVYEIVPILTQFKELVTETARQVGCTGEIEVRVRPFREGSFITEFVVQTRNLLIDLLSSREATALATALGILGFFGIEASIPKMVRAVSGKAGDYKKNSDGTYTYGVGEDAVTVSEQTHQVFQSPKIADLYGKVAVGPIARFEGAVQQINIYVRDEDSPDGGISRGSTFTEGDAHEFAEYAQSAELMDALNSDDQEFVTHGITLSPLAGPYDGAERGYSFTDGGDAVYRGVTIEDQAFLGRLESTEVRFAKGDILVVDFKTVQKTKKSGPKAYYSIIAIHEYRPYIPPHQPSLGLDKSTE